MLNGLLRLWNNGFVGPAEGLVTRACMQNKIVALLNEERIYLRKIDCLTDIHVLLWRGIFLESYNWNYVP